MKLKNMLHIEFSRALKNKFFLLAILTGCIVTIFHFAQNVSSMPQYIEKNIDFGTYPQSVFNKWIGESLGTMEPTLYYLLLPILASLPFADSYFLDMKTGFVKNVLIRTRKSHYYAAKYLATFVAGGIAVVVPLLLNLALTASVLPSLLPKPTAGTFSLFERNMGSGLFLTHPYIYTFLYLALDFVFAGLLAGIALSISSFVSNRFIVVLSPFICYLVFYAFTALTGNLVLCPVVFLQPSQPAGASPFVVVVEIVVLAVVTVSVFFCKGARDETF